MESRKLSQGSTTTLHPKAFSNGDRKNPTPLVRTQNSHPQPPIKEHRNSPLRTRWNSRDTQDPRVTNTIAGCHLRRFRSQTQHANLAHVAIAVTHPHISGTLSISQCRRCTGKLEASPSLSNR